MATQIRTLTADDAPVCFDLRLRALREHPEAFASSYEEERQRPLDDFALRLTPGPGHLTLGAFQEDRLVGIATLVRSNKAKQRHRATLASMYVAPEARGRGLGRALLEGILDVARGWEGLSQVLLAVTVGNRTARDLYAGAGFVSYGIEPRSLCVEGRFFDVEWMSLHWPLGAVRSRPPRHTRA